MLNNLPAQSRFFYCLYYSLLELLGGDKADNVFSAAQLDPFDLIAPEYFNNGSLIIEKISSELCALFGEDAARGLLIRMGSASMVFFRKYFAGIAQLGSIENRLKPLNRRFSASLTKLAEVLSAETGTPQNIIERETRSYEWQMNKTRFNSTGEWFEPYFYFGLLEEFCSWLDSRKNYVLNYTAVEDHNSLEVISVEIREME